MNIFEVKDFIERALKRDNKIRFERVSYDTICVNSETGYYTNFVIPFQKQNENWLYACDTDFPFALCCVPIKHIHDIYSSDIAIGGTKTVIFKSKAEALKVFKEMQAFSIRFQSTPPELVEIKENNVDAIQLSLF